MSYDAARIIEALKKGQRESAGSSGGLELATVTSTSPITVEVDNISFPITRESLMVSYGLPSGIRAGDRVAVARTAINCWVILCKVVSA